MEAVSFPKLIIAVEMSEVRSSLTRELPQTNVEWSAAAFQSTQSRLSRGKPHQPSLKTINAWHARKQTKAVRNSHRRRLWGRSPQNLRWGRPMLPPMETVTVSVSISVGNIRTPMAGVFN